MSRSYAESVSTIGVGSSSTAIVEHLPITRGFAILLPVLLVIIYLTSRVLALNADLIIDLNLKS